MPKNEFTPRNELICGKIEGLAMYVKVLPLSDIEKLTIIEVLQDIQHDAERMEAKLVLRKQQLYNPELNVPF